MGKPRTYVWKKQVRETENDEWVDDLVPSILDIHPREHNTWGICDHVKNAFSVRDGAPAPEEAFRVAAGMPSTQYFVRTILEATDSDGSKIVKVLKTYPKIDENKKIGTEDGVAFAVCLYEDCGAKMVPERASQHLREDHGFAQKRAIKIDHTNQKYFKIVIEHGAKAKEAISVKALRKGKIQLT